MVPTVPMLTLVMDITMDSSCSRAVEPDIVLAAAGVHVPPWPLWHHRPL